jgi:hypothetical protein
MGGYGVDLSGLSGYCRTMLNFPKYMRDAKGRYKVYLHSEPEVGQMFYDLITVGKKKVVTHFVVVEVHKYKDKLRGGNATRIQWQAQDGSQYTSAMRSKTLNKIPNHNPVNCSE